MPIVGHGTGLKSSLVGLLAKKHVRRDSEVFRMKFRAAKLPFPRGVDMQNKLHAEHAEERRCEEVMTCHLIREFLRAKPGVNCVDIWNPRPRGPVAHLVERSHEKFRQRQAANFKAHVEANVSDATPIDELGSKYDAAFGEEQKAISVQTIPFWPSDVALDRAPFEVDHLRNVLSLGRYVPRSGSLIVMSDHDYYMDIPAVMAANPTNTFLLFTKGRSLLSEEEMVLEGGIVVNANGAVTFEHAYWKHDASEQLDYVIVGPSYNKVVFRRDIKRLPLGRLAVLYTPFQKLGVIASLLSDASAPLVRHSFQTFSHDGVNYYYQVYHDQVEGGWQVFVTRERSTAHLVVPLVLAGQAVSMSRNGDVKDHKLKAIVAALSGDKLRYITPLLAMCSAQVMPSFAGASNVGICPPPFERDEAEEAVAAPMDEEFMRSPLFETEADRERSRPVLVASPAFVGLEGASPGFYNSDATVAEAVAVRVLDGQERRAVNDVIIESDNEARVTKATTPTTPPTSEEEEKHGGPEIDIEVIRQQLKECEEREWQQAKEEAEVYEDIQILDKIVDRFIELWAPETELSPMDLTGIGERLRTTAQRAKFEEYINFGPNGTPTEAAKAKALAHFDKHLIEDLVNYPALWNEANEMLLSGELERQVLENSSSGFIKADPSPNAARLIVDFCKQIESAGLVVTLEEHLKEQELFKKIYAFKTPADMMDAMETLQLGGSDTVRCYDFSKMNSHWNETAWGALRKFLKAFFSEEDVEKYLDMTRRGVIHLRLKKVDGPFESKYVLYFWAHQDGTRDTSLFNTLVTIFVLSLVYVKHEMAQGESLEAAIGLTIGDGHSEGRFNDYFLAGGDDSCVGTEYEDDTHPTPEEAQEYAKCLGFVITDESSDPDRQFVVMLGRWWRGRQSSIDVKRQLTKFLTKIPNKSWADHIRDRVLGLLATDPGFLGLCDLRTSLMNGRQGGDLRWIQRCFDPDVNLVYDSLDDEDMSMLLDIQGVHYNASQLKPWQNFIAKLTRGERVTKWPAHPLFTLPDLVYKAGGAVQVDGLTVLVPRGCTLRETLSALGEERLKSARFRSLTKSERRKALMLDAGRAQEPIRPH
jgi:hypothetical protein